MKTRKTLEHLGKNLLPSEKPLGVENEEEPLAGRGIPSEKFPQGRVAFDRKGFTLYQGQPIDSKREYLKNQWLDLTYLLLGKATTLAQTVTKKDFGRLVQILTSAGIAHDKVFPKVIDPSVNHLVVNMFKGLPSEKVLRVIGEIPSPQIPLEGNSLEGKPLEH